MGLPSSGAGIVKGTVSLIDMLVILMTLGDAPCANLALEKDSAREDVDNK